MEGNKTKEKEAKLIRKIVLGEISFLDKVVGILHPILIHPKRGPILVKILNPLERI